ncbi:MAG: glycosyltransferase family 1 protein [Pseudomonadota bacterium]
MRSENHRANSLRIALFSGNYNYQRDGANMALNRLVDFMERQGAEVLVFSPTSQEPAFEPAGTLVSVPSAPIPFRSEYRIAFGLPKRIRSQIVDFKPNLIHLSAPDLLGRAALRLSARLGVPAVASFHTRFDTYLRYYGLSMLEPAARGLMRSFYSNCEHVYAPSESVAQTLREQGWGRDVRLWSRGVDHTQFQPERRDMAWRRSMGIADTEVAVAFVGRLVLEKGLECFGRVVDTLRARGVAFRPLIVGDGPERQWMEERMPESAGAVFTGFLEGEDLARAYASADVFFNPSKTETFGNVTLEAMASGLPTVCANATGSRSIVVDGETGYLVETSQANGYADALQRLLQDADLRAAMSASALVRSRDFGWDVVMLGLLAQYEEVLARWREEGRGDAARGALARRSLARGWTS